MKKSDPLTREEAFSQVTEVYRYSREVAGRLYLFHQLIRSTRFPQQFKSRGFESEPLKISEVLREIKQLRERLSKRTESIYKLIREIISEDHDREPLPWQILRSIDRLTTLIEKITSLRSPPFTVLPIEGIDIEWVDEKPWFEIRGIDIETSTKNELFFDYIRLSGDFNGSNLENAFDAEITRIWSGLPSVLAYLNTLERTKSKKSRSSGAIEKERDYLFLLDQYEKWKVKQREDTGRKRFNPKDWLKDFDSWTSKSQRLFDRWTESEEGPDDIVIVAIIKYAQKMKREREGSDE